MTDRRRGVGLTPMETRRDVIVRGRRARRRAGIRVFAVPEGWGLDSTPVLTEIALRTTGIQVVSGILSVWGRTPATLAMTAATLHQVSGGGYILGLGASTRALAEGFHDIPFEHPAARLRDAVTEVRALLDGQPAQLRHASAARPLRLGQPPAPEVPIWVAALGEHTTAGGRRTRRRLDPRPGRPRQPPRLAGPAERAARSRRAACAPLTVAAGPITVAGDDAGTARDIAASCTAWYLTAMGDVYARSVSGQGYAAEVKEIIAANPRPHPRRGIVPDDARAVLGQVAASGTRDQVREQLETWDDAADVVSIVLPPGLPWPVIEATLLAAAPGT